MALPPPWRVKPAAGQAPGFGARFGYFATAFRTFSSASGP